MKTFFDYSLKAHNTFGIDAYATTYIVIETQDDVSSAIHQYGLPHHILGGGSNIILPGCVEGITRHIGIQGIHLEGNGNNTTLCTIGAGENWHKTVLYTIKKGLWGIENLIAIPGDVGASPVQNIGAYGVELQDIFVACSVYDTKENIYTTLVKKDCHFGYRDSIFKQQPGRYIILDITLQLSNTPKPILTYKPIADQISTLYPDTSNITQQQIAQVIEQTRWSKLPKPDILGNCGSFFKNPIVSTQMVKKLLEVYPTMPHYTQGGEVEKLSAAWLIDICGLKGYSNNRVGIYEKQPLIIVNINNATQQDVILFSQEIISIVLEKTGIQIEREVNIL